MSGFLETGKESERDERVNDKPGQRSGGLKSEEVYKRFGREFKIKRRPEKYGDWQLEKTGWHTEGIWEVLRGS